MLETARPLDDPRQSDESLVSVRTGVLNDAEHAVGNLLQRLHHVARVAGSGLGAQGERLHGALDDLERLLELLFDYVSPVEVRVRPTEAARVAESLVAQVRAHAGAGLRVSNGSSPQLLADPRVLGRSFQLLGRAYGGDWASAREISIEMRCEEPCDRTELVVRSARSGGGAFAADSNLAAAVAGRLIELQGGELCCTERADLSLCCVVLPTVK